MNTGRQTSRRGAALLIVLATLILTTTAATIVVRAAVTHQVDDRIDHCSRIADDLLPAAETPIQEWLADKSSKVVLPPDVPSPEVAVLHDLFVSQNEPIELIITAWDQCGMVPLQAVEDSSPLRLTLSDEILRQIPHRPLDAPAITLPPGLDQFIALGDADGSLPPSPFPVATGSGDSLHFGDVPEPANQSETALTNPIGTPRLGALVATHAGAIIINVNTAPIPLVETALRLCGRGGLEQVIAARQAGKPANVGGQAIHNAQPDQVAPQLLTVSTCWAFRIDINVGPRKCSWWAIYQNASGMWSCVQRLAITH